MFKTSIVSAAAILSFTGHSFAQPAGVTAEMIATALPVEGAPLAVPGPYAVTSGIAFGSPGHMVFHPTNLDAFPAKDTLPVVVWGNGGCAIDSTRYGGFLSTIASHGFLVLGTAAQQPRATAESAQGAASRRSTADDLRAALDWVEKENARAGSPLKAKIALDKVAVMGQSCGGTLSIELGADPRVDTIGVFNSGVRAAEPGAAPSAPALALPKVHGPVLLINGHDRDFMMATSLATYEAINNQPAFYGARHGAGHTATVFHPGGGEYANVASNWVMWQFKGDKKAAAMFVGKDCGLCTNTNWDTKSKGLKAP